MSNEEWLKNLKPGDNVAIVNQHGGGAKSAYRGVVVNISAKTKKIKVTHVGGETTFSSNGRWSSGYFSRSIEPLEGAPKTIIEADETKAAASAAKNQTRNEKISQLPAVPASEVVRILDQAKRDLEETSVSLRNRLDCAVRDMARAKESIGTESDFYINRLGILQGSGPEIERLSALYHQQKDFVEELLALVPGAKDL